MEGQEPSEELNLVAKFQRGSAKKLVPITDMLNPLEGEKSDGDSEGSQAGDEALSYPSGGDSQDSNSVKDMATSTNCLPFKFVPKTGMFDEDEILKSEKSQRLGSSVENQQKYSYRGPTSLAALDDGEKKAITPRVGSLHTIPENIRLEDS